MVIWYNEMKGEIKNLSNELKISLEKLWPTQRKKINIDTTITEKKNENQNKLKLTKEKKENNLQAGKITDYFKSNK